MAGVVRSLTVMSVAIVLLLSSVLVDAAHAASSSGCFVSLHGSLEVSRLIRVHEVVAWVDSRCQIHISETKSSATPTGGPRNAAVMASSLRGCRTDNIMWDDLGLADMTRLRESIEFYYDGSTAVLNNHFGSAYTAGGSPYSSSNFSEYAYASGPASTIEADASADYYWWGSYDHYKTIWAYGYYNGNCYSEYSHVGNVCRTCRVIARLTYYI